MLKHPHRDFSESMVQMTLTRKVCLADVISGPTYIYLCPLEVMICNYSVFQPQNCQQHPWNMIDGCTFFYFTDAVTLGELFTLFY